jgi:hypothetical protein
MTPRIPWGPLILSVLVVAAVGTGRAGLDSLAGWKKAYLVGAGTLLALAMVLDALAGRRKRR